MTRRSFALSAFIPRISPLVVLFLLGAPTAQAKQCSAEQPSDSKAHWSYRLIDGRKCWYEGENGLSKSSLHWATDTPASSANMPVSLSPPRSTQSMRPAPQPKSSTSVTGAVSPVSPPAQRASDEAPVRILSVKPNNPLALNDNDGFEERWRALEALGKY
ncbi:MAG: hypothetical protein QOC84_583 [Bradyrhizobium sp.]|jgi:hypothetical protein|nr:hypothetical protein [Bradyrhizobium sp.]